MMKPGHLLLVGFIAAIVFFYFEKKDTDDVERHALKQLDLVMTGVVDSVDKLHGYNGTGVVRLKILTTNVTNYDPRNKLKYYYCIIKNGIAEVYDGSANSVNTGDTVSINTAAKSISWTQGGKKQEATIFINTDHRFYKYIKKHHQKL